MGELGVIVPSGLRWLYVQGMRLCIVLSDVGDDGIKVQ